LKYESYKDQTISEIFTPDQLKNAAKLDANELASSILINDGSAKFTLKTLPIEAQVSPVYAIEIADFDSDSHPDILLGGNLYRAKPEVGRYDASYGIYLKGDGKGNFKPLSAKESGMKIDGEVRDIITIKKGKTEIIIAARNNNTVAAFKKLKQ